MQESKLIRKRLLALVVLLLVVAASLTGVISINKASAVVICTNFAGSYTQKWCYPRDVQGNQDWCSQWLILEHYEWWRTINNYAILGTIYHRSGSQWSLNDCCRDNASTTPPGVPGPICC